MIVSDLERSTVDPVLVEHKLGHHLPCGLLGLRDCLRERGQIHSIVIRLVAIDIPQMEEVPHLHSRFKLRTPILSALDIPWLGEKPSQGLSDLSSLLSILIDDLGRDRSQGDVCCLLFVEGGLQELGSVLHPKFSAQVRSVP